MKKTELMNKVSRGFHKVGFTIKKRSPEILVATGVVGIVGSTVLACRATLKIDQVAENAQNKIDRINKAVETGVTDAGETYTIEDSEKDLAILHIQTGFEYVKLYAPAVALGAASLGCILTSHRVLHKRNAAIAAAYTAVFNDFKGYRSRVIERFGKELDRELKYNIQTKEVEEIVVDENGKETVVKNTVEVIDPKSIDPTSKFFDASCRGWTKDPEANLLTLKSVEAWATNKLTSEGYLYLNDVYEALGIDKTPIGQTTGWVYGLGDNFVDFGIYNGDRERNRAFINGHESVLLLEFNHDGYILDKI